MKIAVMYDERDGFYKVYKYSWFFKLFGADFTPLIACDFSDAAGAIERAGRQINGKIKLIRIAEI